METLPSHEVERQFLESIRDQYETKGFRFTIEPQDQQLPDFLGSYRPDAIAQRPGENIAIEVKHRQSQAGSAKLEELSHLFSGHPEWTFKVVYAGTNPNAALQLEPVSAEELLAYVERVEGLKAVGEYAAAFIMAWSLLEAALRSVDGQARIRPLTPGTVVQSLVMNGHLSDTLGRELTELITLRNRAVHGDITTVISAADVDTVLGAVTAVLSAGVRTKN
jgi:hypothetical protein